MPSIRALIFVNIIGSKFNPLVNETRSSKSSDQAYKVSSYSVANLWYNLLVLSTVFLHFTGTSRFYRSFYFSKFVRASYLGSDSLRAPSSSGTSRTTFSISRGLSRRTGSQSRYRLLRLSSFQGTCSTAYYKAEVLLRLRSNYIRVDLNFNLSVNLLIDFPCFYFLFIIASSCVNIIIIIFALAHQFSKDFLTRSRIIYQTNSRITNCLQSGEPLQKFPSNFYSDAKATNNTPPSNKINAR